MYFEADELDRFGLRKDDVLACEGGEPGRAAVWDGRLPDLKFQKALHRVRFNVPYEPKLLVYFLQTLSKTRDWEDRFHGATIKHFTREMFIELPVPVPPLPEQKRIVAEMDAEAAQIEAVRGLVPRLRSQNPARPHPRLGHGNVTVRGELPYLIETGQVSQVTYWQQVIILLESAAMKPWMARHWNQAGLNQ